MQVFAKPSRLIFLCTFLFLVLTGCTQSTPTPEPDVFTPECDVPSLRKAINDANLTPSIPGEIQLPNNCLYTLKEVDNTVLWQGLSIHSGLPAIISEITIQGNNAVIEILPDPGEAQFGHFFLEVEKKLKLYDLTLKDGARYIGGAVVSNHGDLFAYNVKFLNNLAFPESMDNVGKGGAIFSYLGKVRIRANSLFQQNMAGQTLSAGSNLGGAVYSFNSSLSINNSYFLDNYAAGHGGAVYAVKTPAGLGGGLVTIQNSEFSQNWALEDGGGVYIIGESDGAFIASSMFDENRSEGLGGAVFSEDSDLHIISSEFQWNQAEHGGAVYTRRSAAGEPSQLLSDNDVFLVNTAAGNGGAIFSENSDLELEDGLVSHNLADSCGAIQLGGYPGLDVVAGDLETATQIHSSSKIFSSSISDNDAISGYGGGVCHLMGELDIRETDFINNYTPTYGGALISMDQLNISDSTFEINQANRGAGLVIGFPLDDNNYVSPTYLNHQAYIDQSSFSGNIAQDAGGGIWIHNGAANQIIKSVLGGNIASAEGGGIYLDEGDLYVNNSTLADNTAFRGGGIYNVGDNSKLTLTHTTVAYNTATDGGNGSRSGGGGINIKTLIVMQQVLVVLNTNEDCSIGPIKVTGGQAIFQDRYYLANTYGVDSDGTCVILETEDVPQIGGFNGTYVPIQGGSPLIDRVGDNTCYRSDDQIGTLRKQGLECEAGSIEYDPNAPLPPAPLPPPPLPPTPEPSDETADCDPFSEMEISVHMLNINPANLSLPVYLRFPGAVPGIGEDGTMPYRGNLGGEESSLCNQQGFEDRLYCMFTLQPSTPGTLQNLEIFKEDCPDPIFTLPSLTIPELPNEDQPTVTCQADLGPNACKKAGGNYVDHGLAAPPECVCP